MASPRCHISNDGLPAFVDVDMFDADKLPAAVTEAAKDLDLGRIGP
jgi:hypothetical protein